MGSHYVFLLGAAYGCWGLGVVFLNGRMFGGMGNAEFLPEDLEEFVSDDADAETSGETAEQGAPKLDEHFLHGKWGYDNVFLQINVLLSYDTSKVRTQVVPCKKSVVDLHSLCCTVSVR